MCKREQGSTSDLYLPSVSPCRSSSTLNSAQFESPAPYGGGSSTFKLQASPDSKRPERPPPNPGNGGQINDIDPDSSALNHPASDNDREGEQIKSPIAGNKGVTAATEKGLKQEVPINVIYISSDEEQ